MTAKWIITERNADQPEIPPSMLPAEVNRLNRVHWIGFAVCIGTLLFGCAVGAALAWGGL